MRGTTARRSRTWDRIVRWAPYGVIVLAVKFATARFSRSPAAYAVCAIAALLAGAELLRRRIRDRRLHREERARGRWPLGLPYPAEVTQGKRKSSCQVLFDEVEIVRETRFGLTSEELPLTAVRFVRVRPSWVEIEWPGNSFRIAPKSYEDRQRLLWELAVRLPDAMERAMDEEEARTAPAVASPAPAPAVAEPSPPVGGLASALAGPASPANPAPPRKSGLGVGLFAPPPR